MIKIVTFIVLLLSILHFGQSKDTLKCGEELEKNQYLQSKNCYFAVMQGDCNFVVYRSKHFVPRNALWSSKTANSNCKNPKLVNQEDGNLVVYDGKKALWSSKTNKPGEVCYHLVMQTDGNLVLYTIDNKPVWNTGTAA